MLHKLTGRTVQGAKPLDRPYEIRCTETKGFLLRVQPSGVKSYVLEFGRGKRRTIGSAAVLTLEQARITARQWLADRDGGKLPAAARGKSRPLTLGEFIKDKYQPWVESERRAGKATLAALKAQFGAEFYGKRLDQITPYSVDSFKARRLRDGIKPATVNRDLVRIRAVLGKAVEWGLLDTHPLAGVKPVKGDDEGRVRYLTADEEKRLREALVAREAERRQARESGNRWNAERGRPERRMWPEDGYTEHLVPIVLLAVNTGLRRGELFGLRWSDIDQVHHTLTVRAATAKGQRSRRVPLNEEAQAVLSAWKKSAAKPPAADALVFPGAEGARLTNVNKAWATLVKDAKIADLRFHDLRHHFASRLVMSGVDLYAVQQLLGHQDMEQTQRYAHLSPEHKRAAVARLDRVQS